MIKIMGRLSWLETKAISPKRSMKRVYMSTVTETEKKHKCPVCSKPFLYMNNLNAHLYNFHEWNRLQILQYQVGKPL